LDEAVVGTVAAAKASEDDDDEKRVEERTGERHVDHYVRWDGQTE
jgi:hypothetical protein